MKKTILSFLIVFYGFSSIAQTGIFIYKDQIEERPNVHIIDIKEGADKQLYILGEAKDKEFQNPYPWFARIDNKGKLIKSVYPHKDNTSGMLRLIIASNQRIMLYGNTNDNGKAKPFSILLNDDGGTNTLNVMAMSYPMIIGDVVPYSNKKSLIVQSNRNKETGVFNIGLIKADNDKYLPIPFKTLVSDKHELVSKVFLTKEKNILIAGYKIIDEDFNIKPFIYYLDSLGENLWSYYPEFSTDFENISIAQDKDGNILVASSYRDKKLGPCKTILLRINSKGEKTEEKIIDDIKSNGLLLLKNGNILMYGTHYQVYNDMMIISKANFFIFNSKLEKQVSDELGMLDNPDYNLPSLAVTAQPTSSEFNTAIQLTDGRVVLAGRVYMPDKVKPDEILLSPRYNQPMILFMNEKGTFRSTPK